MLLVEVNDVGLVLVGGGDAELLIMVEKVDGMLKALAAETGLEEALCMLTAEAELEATAGIVVAALDTLSVLLARRGFASDNESPKEIPSAGRETGLAVGVEASCGIEAGFKLKGRLGVGEEAAGGATGDALETGITTELGATTGMFVTTFSRLRV